LTSAKYYIDYAPATLNVTPAPLTATVSGTLTNGGTPAFTASYSGFVNGEGSSAVTGTLACATNATATSTPGPGYTISNCTGPATPNYAISYSYGTLAVQRSPSFTSAGSATFATGQYGSFTVTTGPTYPTPTISCFCGLPQGVTFTDNHDGTATLAGIPAPGQAGYDFGAFLYAVNAVGSADQEVLITVTAPPPTASITTPLAGATYALGQVVTSSFTCTNSIGGPGIASCRDQNGNGSGAAIDTATGSHTLTVTATSNDGQTGTASANYTAAPGSLGFTQPLPKTKLVSSTATIPVKFQLGTYQGVLLADTVAKGVATKVTISSQANGSQPLSAVSCLYSATGHLYQCSLKTPAHVQTGTTPYYISAYEQIGTRYVTVPPAAAPRTPNPEIVYFK
jgi:hypothetical protein